MVEGRDATLSNRFKPHDEVKTTTILQIDDDMLARPQGVIAGLKASLEHPDQLVSWGSCVKIAWGSRYARWLPAMAMHVIPANLDSKRLGRLYPPAQHHPDCKSPLSSFELTV